VPEDTLHPELYIKLLRWRSETADEHEMKPRQVLRTRSLRDLVQFLPTTIASLKRINRIGDATAHRFGAAIVGMISAYCDSNNIATNLMRFEQKKD
jgi:ribonuclease D